MHLPFLFLSVALRILSFLIVVVVAAAVVVADSYLFVPLCYLVAPAGPLSAHYFVADYSHFACFYHLYYLCSADSAVVAAAVPVALFFGVSVAGSIWHRYYQG